jgi:hypothetical protein
VKQIRKRLTYANVMSSIAVFLILGGATAFAATKIGSGQLKANSVLTGKIKKEAVTSSKIKNNSITTSKIADRAVTGAKIDASTLGTVPNTTNAINAQNAANANAINGQSISKIVYGANSGGGPTTVFSSHGLTISASCTGGNVALIATTSKTNSSIYSVVVQDAPVTPTLEADTEGGGFDPGVNFDLLAGGNGNINFVQFEFDALDGTVATGTIVTDEAGSATTCVATGRVIIG